MREIKIKLSEESYDKIIKLVNWMNQNNQLTARSEVNDYAVEDFIKGAAISKMEDIEQFIPLSKYNIQPSTIVKNRFKEIAKERNVRQVDICNALDMHKSNLSVIFNNKDQPRSETFFKIWALLRCPPIHKCIYFEG